MPFPAATQVLHSPSYATHSHVSAASRLPTLSPGCSRLLSAPHGSSRKCNCRTPSIPPVSARPDPNGPMHMSTADTAPMCRPTIPHALCLDAFNTDAQNNAYTHTEQHVKIHTYRAIHTQQYMHSNTCTAIHAQQYMNSNTCTAQASTHHWLEMVQRSGGRRQGDERWSQHSTGHDRAS